MTDFVSEAGAVQQGARYIDEYHESLTTTVTDTARNATSAADTWIGQGGDAYRALVEQWRTAGKKVIAELTEFAANLRAADEASHSTDSDLQNQMGKLAESALDFSKI